MGIVKISEDLHTAAKHMAKAMDRSVNAQAEHWMRIGKVIEANPTLTYQTVRAHFVRQAFTESAVDEIHEK